MALQARLLKSPWVGKEGWGANGNVEGERGHAKTETRQPRRI